MSDFRGAYLVDHGLLPSLNPGTPPHSQFSGSGSRDMLGILKPLFQFGIWCQNSST